MAEARGDGGLSRPRPVDRRGVFTVSAPAQASVAARQIVEELRHQYVLAFEASATPGWRSLEVRARSRDLVVRARAGYMVAGTVGEASADR